MLPDNFPAKDILTHEGYESIDDVSEATNEEILGIAGIAEGTLAKIRDVAPYKPSAAESGIGETSKISSPTESFQTQTSVISKDRISHSGQPLPDGIVKNERGTYTASSTADQEDMVHPDQVREERQANLRRAGEQIAALTKQV